MKQGEAKATVWLAEGCEEMEAVIALDVLRRGTIDVRGMTLGPDLDVRGAHGVQIRADTGWDETWLAGADLLVVPGGMGGMEALRADPRVLEHIRRADREGRFVGAVCAGPLVLAAAGILKGRKATCYPGLEQHLQGVERPADPVVRDGNLITSLGPATAMAFAVELVRALAGEAVAREVAQGLLLPH